MRIGTWNLENHQDAKRLGLQRATILDAHCDIFVLTEVSLAFDVGPGGSRSTVLLERDDTSWVAAVGDSVMPMDDPCFTTVSSVVVQAEAGDEGLIVVGSVLPWKTAASQAPELRRGDETYIQMFERTLNSHGDVVHHLQLAHRDAIVIWAGDFNQSLSGSNAGASNTARALLSAKLEELGLVAWNEHAAHANPRIKAIDLICGPASRSVLSVERIDPFRDGIQMSDHAGYIVEI